ncbi:uncharacterized protein [Centruroides vittatus]|uniref:uncharacterized protein isoform X1 n=2 Tax=Centruroides vittatus TaxID=120091 RepID=UPI00350ECE7F
MSDHSPKTNKQYHPRMDELLAKLRRSMAELSLQGDDFTRQMWQMYAIFEEVIASRTDSRSSHISHHHLHQGESVARDDFPLTSHQPKAEESGSEREARQRQDGSQRQSPRKFSPGARKKRMSAGQYHHYQLRCHHRTRSEPTSNPLLDTISVLTTDPCDSDDYYDLAAAYQQRRMLSNGEEIKTRSSPSCQHHTSDMDRDSIGYAGSNSIDSGYKSLCPTPEIPDGYYGAEGGRASSCGAGGATDSSSSNSSPSCNRDKPKIMMGTRVMGRQCPRPRGPPPPPGPSRKGGDPALHDVNLDHLMYLRQSLISAIQRCESSSSSQSREGSPTVTRGPPIRRGSTGSPKRTQSPQVERRRAHTHSAGVPSPRRTSPNHHHPPPGSSSSSSASSPSYQKTVRFDTDIKVAASAVKAKQTAQVQSAGGSPRSTRKQSKSILKDPLCASLRSQLESGDRLTPDCSMEEEIDALLYGRAEYYDLESVEDFPCSYVTMIEEKYRCGRANIAKVKKLKEPSNKAEECHSAKVQANPEASLVLATTAASSRSVTKVIEDCPDRGRSQCEPPADCKPSAKSRFTEVAKCMLEIIEDLQLQVDTSGTAIKDAGAVQALTAATEVDSASAVSVTYHTTAADYHVYEEILYDFVAGAAAAGRPTDFRDTPPPLPARPSGMTQKQERTIFAQTVVSTTVSTEVSDFSRASRNCPKQRSNLYSLVRDQAERRDISRSLEREWKGAHEPGDLEDEYGFKKSYPSS